MKVKLFWVNAPLKDKGFVISDSGGHAREFEREIGDGKRGQSDLEKRGQGKTGSECL